MGYATPEWIEIVRDLGIVLGVIVAFVSAVVAVGRFLIVKPLERYIDVRMPKNGGKSLGDLHTKVDDMATRISRIEREIMRIDEELEHIAE